MIFRIPIHCRCDGNGIVVMRGNKALILEKHTMRYLQMKGKVSGMSLKYSKKKKRWERWMKPDQQFDDNC